MNGTKDFGAYGHAAQAQAHSLMAEASRGRPTTRSRRHADVRFRIGRVLVLAGSRLMRRRIEVPDFELAQPA